MDEKRGKTQRVRKGERDEVSQIELVIRCERKRKEMRERQKKIERSKEEEKERRREKGVTN